MPSSWRVPAGGSSVANYTNTGLCTDGTNLYICNANNGIVQICTPAGVYVSQIVLGGTPPTGSNQLQGVTIDTSDNTIWCSFTVVGGGTFRHYQMDGTFIESIDVAGIGVDGPNSCVYDAANDRILGAFSGGRVFGFSCTTLSATPVESITVTGFTTTSPNSLDGLTLDPTDPAGFLWLTCDGSGSAALSELGKVNRSTGAVVLSNRVPTSVEGIAFLGGNIYMCADQFFHITVTNGNRVWKLNPNTGEPIEGVGLQAKVLSFTLNTASTGTGSAQKFNGFGFPPKLLFIFGTPLAAGVNAQTQFGMVDREYRQNSAAIIANDGVIPTTNRKSFSSTLGFTSLSAAGAVARSLFVTSMTHDGFAGQVVSDADPNQRLQVLAVGGDDIDAFVGTFGMTTGTGTQAVTGVGFTPQAVVFSNSATNNSTGAVTTESRLMIGAMTRLQQWCLTMLGTGGATPNADEQGVARTDAALVQISNALATSMLASFSSLDSDGFTINKTTGPAATTLIGYMAIKGPARVALASFDQPAATGNQAVTGLGFAPVAELFASAGRVASTTPTASGAVMIGAADSATSRAVVNATTLDAGAASDAASDISEALCLVADSFGGVPTRLAAADFISHDTNGFTVNWTTADATARQNFALAFGPAANSIIGNRAITRSITRELTRSVT